MDHSEIRRLLEDQGEAWKEFRQKQFDPLRAVVQQLEARQQRMNFGAGGGSFDTPADTKALNAALHKLLAGDDRELKAMSVGSDPDGGFMVHATLSSSINKVEFDFSPLRQIARIVPIESDAFEEPLDKDTAAAAWVSEQGARPATANPKLAKLRIPVHEIYSFPFATQSLIDDASFDVVEWLSGKVGQQFGVAEGVAFVNGTGVGQPRGFATYPTEATADAARAWGKFEHVLTGTAGGFGADPNGATKLIDVVHKLKAGYRKGAVWLMNKATAGEVRKLKDTAGRFVWVDSLMAGMPSSLLGYPVVEAEDMPAIAANSLSIAFGNFQRGYTIVDRIGMRVLVDNLTNKPLVGVYTTKRVGGDVSDFHAVKLLKFA